MIVSFSTMVTFCLLPLHHPCSWLWVTAYSCCYEVAAGHCCALQHMNNWSQELAEPGVVINNADNCLTA
jgi:hypothetical protein